MVELITGVNTINNQNSIGPYSLDLNDGRINSAPEEDASTEAGQGKQFNFMDLLNVNENPFANIDAGVLGNQNGLNNIFGGFNTANGLNSILGAGANQGGFNTANGLNSILGAGANGFGQNIFSNLNNFGCPYSSPSFGNYPALKGKFTGCCKRHQCFYPRSALQAAFWCSFVLRELDHLVRMLCYLWRRKTRTKKGKKLQQESKSSKGRSKEG